MLDTVSSYTLYFTHVRIKHLDNTQLPMNTTIALSNRIKLVETIWSNVMVDSVPVTSRDHFAVVADEQQEDADENLNTAQHGELYDIWQEYARMHGERVMFKVPGWFSENEFGARRPFCIGTIGHDDPSSGAILFEDVQMINISVVENEALCDLEEEDDGFARSYDELDISDDDDYIDESGKTWVPRSLMTVFQHQ